MKKRTLTRRDFVRLTAVGTAGVLAGCVAPTPQVIKEQVEVTRIVEVAGTPKVETVIEEREVVVTATPAPTAEAETAGIKGFPRNETLYANQLSGVTGTPTNFNEWVGWKWRDRGTAQLINEPLWTIDPAIGKVIDGLADGPAVYNKDFTEMTIKLRQGVYWSDDVEFTSDDVVYTIQTVKATAGLNFNAQLVDVADVTAPDKYTVVVKLSKPNSRFHTYFLDRWGCLWMMPKHVFEKVDDILTFEYNPPLSLGPYVLHSFDPNGFWTASVLREDWKRTPTGMLYGQPVPKYVVFIGHSDISTQVMEQARHELDYAELNMDGLRAAMAQNPKARAYRPAFPFVFNLDPCITGISFNDAKAPWNNKDVRWALTLAIDIVSYITTAYDGAATMSCMHVSAMPLLVEKYYDPMQPWLKDFTLDLGNGETFKPYDPDAPQRLAEYAQGRGYTVAPEDIKNAFGSGWWKSAPDVAAKLLEKNGFKRNADGKWLLPDGTPWKFSIMTSAQPGHPMTQNAYAARYEWRKFGIDVDVVVDQNANALYLTGDFDVSTAWPSPPGSWGGHVDLFRDLDPYNSAYQEPLGQNTWGHTSRWSDPAMDKIIEQLKQTDWWGDTDKIVELGTEGLKLLVETMGPALCTFTYPGVFTWDTTYWTNWPGSENLYMMPYPHWPNFKYQLPSLKATGA